MQATPLSVNDAGTGLLPNQTPTKPMFAEPLVPRVAFQPRLVALTCWPDWAQVALQVWAICWSTAGNANRSVHPLTGSPTLVTATSAWKPPVHWLVTT